MGSLSRIAIATAFAATALTSTVMTAASSAFVAWQVTDVPWGDVLNVRKYPSSGSQIQSANPNGTVLSMTGRCTGGVDLFAIQGLAHWKQRQIVRYKWCEVWHDPAQDGHFVAGWVYGKYITPS
jgi:hypothetical protein